MTRHKVKITVLKVLVPEDIFGNDAPVNPEIGEIHEKCPMHKVGQEFYVTHNYGKPCQCYTSGVHSTRGSKRTR